MEQRLVDRFEELLESDQSDPEIQYQIGLCYQRGEGVEQSGTEAEKWLRRAEAQGHRGAAALLAGPGGEQESLSGELTWDTLPDWCLQAENGDGEAQYQVGCYFLQNPDTQEEGERYLEKAVEQGSGQACLILGRRMLERGQAEQAVAMLRRAADSGGQPEAAFLLGRCYMEGAGVPQDPEIAEQYMTQGAEAGGSETMVEVAARYAVGEGLPHAPVKGLSWLKRAENAGMKDAQARYDARCDQLRRQQRDRADRAAEEASQRELEARRQAEQAARSAAEAAARQTELAEQQAREKARRARDEAARWAEEDRFRLAEDARQAAEVTRRQAEELRREEEAAQREETVRLQKQRERRQQCGQEGRILLLLGVLGPLELAAAVIIWALLNLFHINGFDLHGTSKLLLLPLLLLPISFTLLAGGLQKLQEAGEQIWYFDIPGSTVARTGYWSLIIALEAFMILRQIYNSLNILTLLWGLLSGGFLLGTLFAFNEWLMKKLDIQDCFFGGSKK